MTDFGRITPGRSAPTFENCNNPDKEKCPWKVGQKVYLVNNEGTYRRTSSIINSEYLGKRYKIDSIEWYAYSIIGYIRLVSLETGRTVPLTIHQSDLNKENTYVNPFPVIPKLFKDVSKLDAIRFGFSGHYSMYIANAEDNESIDDLLHNCNEFSYNDPCDECDSGECNTCNEEGGDGINIDFGLKVQGFVNTDTDCWGDGAEIIRSVQKHFGCRPNRMGVILRYTDLEHSYGGSVLEFSEIQNFIKYMKECKALPNYISVPEDYEDGQSLLFKIHLEELSPERMYWYFCTLRAPVQTPDIVRITCFLIEKYNMDGLLAYILSHVISSTFCSGHSVVSSGKLQHKGYTFRRGDIRYPLPDYKAVLTLAVRCRRFLTTETALRMADSEFVKEWRLDTHLMRKVVPANDWSTTPRTQHRMVKPEFAFDIRFKVPEETTIENFHTFSVADRKLRLEEIKV